MDAVYKVDQSKVIHEVFDDEVVIVNLDTGNYYSVRGVGAQIWQQLMAASSRNLILQTLTQRYAGEPQQIIRDTREFLDELVRESLVTAVEQAATAGGDQARTPPEKLEPFSKPMLDKYTDMEKLLLIDPVHQVDEMGWPHQKTPG